MDAKNQRSRALISCDHFLHNIGEFRRVLGPYCLLCLSIKADAYGHGSTQMGKLAQEVGVSYFGVSSLEEAKELRIAGVTGTILLFVQESPPALEELPLWCISPFVGDRSYIDSLAKAAEKVKNHLSVHLMIDTGMGRLGCQPSQAVELAHHIHRSPLLSLGGVGTHLAVSESAHEDDVLFTHEQIHLFENILKALKESALSTGIIHIANSGGVLFYPTAHLQMARPGIGIYGYHPNPARPGGASVDLKPVMQLESSVIFLKRVSPGATISYGKTWRAPRSTIVATIAIGYADGYNRLLSNRGEVWIRNKRYPIIGRVCMDTCMVDLGEHTEVELYDRAVLFGWEKGSPDAADIATAVGGIANETLCHIGKRVRRVYLPPTKKGVDREEILPAAL